MNPPLPGDVRRVGEAAGPGDVPLRVHPDWTARFPWLVQGTTGSGVMGDAFDMGLFGAAPVGRVLRRWQALRKTTGMAVTVHSLQVHGTEIRVHAGDGEGLIVTEGYDGHLTDRPGVLLTVSVADCVPISVVDPERRRIALLHGGWRGTARGILPRGLERFGRAAASRLHVHLGPAICGRCYEVGPAVHGALGLPVPAAGSPVDLRAVLARQALDAGVPATRVTASEHCTRCGDGFFSHRGHDPERQVGVLGVRT